MTNRFDESFVHAKASNILQSVTAIRLINGPEHGAVADWIRLDATVLNLQRAVEAMVVLAEHLISASGWELPRDDRHAFSILAENGLLSPAELALTHALVGFRNVAVHDDAALDPEIVGGIVQSRLGDLEDLVDGLLARLTLAPAAS